MDKQYLAKDKERQKSVTLSLVHERVEVSDQAIPEVFINVCIEWEQKEWGEEEKKKRNKSGHRCRLSSFNHHRQVSFLYLTAVFFFFISSVSFFYFRKLASIIHCCPHACSIVVIHIISFSLSALMYIESFDRVWWMQTDIWSSVCLLMFMSFSSQSK